MQRRPSIRNGNTKISRRRPRSVDDAELSHISRCCFAEDVEEMYKDL